LRNVHARLSKLEGRIVPQSPPVRRSKVLPEMRALFEELSPILEQSEAYRKILEEAKVHGVMEETLRAFWMTMRELLLPHPALYHRMDELLRKQIEANEAVATKHAGGERTR
jgi:hypothetical protein